MAVEALNRHLKMTRRNVCNFNISDGVARGAGNDAEFPKD
jgi:hypothetical protein